MVTVQIEISTTLATLRNAFQSSSHCSWIRDKEFVRLKKWEKSFQVEGLG